MVEFQQFKDLFARWIVVPWVQAVLILVGFFLITKVLAIITEKIVLKLTKKTKTKLDDEFVIRSRNPVSLFLLVIGIKMAFNHLTFSDTLTTNINNIIATILIIIGANIFYIFIDFIIKLWVTKFASKTDSTLDDHIGSFFEKSAIAVVVVIAFLMILSSWGVQIGPLLASLGVAGVAVAFAMQSSLSNIFGGISMIFDRTIHVGDVVKLDDGTWGTIHDIGLRSTKIKTYDNEIIILPNGKLADSRVENLVQPDPSMRVVVPFGVAYGSDVEKVKKIVLAEIDKIKGIKKDKKRRPFVWFLEMGDSALSFKAYFYMNSYLDVFSAKDEANTRIYNALNKNKISIPFPQMDVHLKKR